MCDEKGRGVVEDTHEHIKILVKKDSSIEIVFKYSDLYLSTIEYMKMLNKK